jgi:hypothetical protein
MTINRLPPDNNDLNIKGLSAIRKGLSVYIRFYISPFFIWDTA